MGVGRWLLLHLHELFDGDRRLGPHVLLLSGTSWAGKAPGFHIQVPVSGVLRSPDTEVEAIAESQFRFFPIYDNNQKPISVSGTNGSQRIAALKDILYQLARRSGLSRISLLEKERDSLPASRQRLLLLVGSYEEARLAHEALENLRPDWQGQIRHLVPDDDEFESQWRGSEQSLQRGLVHQFANTGAWILIAPLLAVERGHNILNEDDEAAIGAAYFLVRPHPRPDDINYAIHSINRWAVERCSDAAALVQECQEEQLTLERVGTAFRQAAYHRWRSLLHMPMIYSTLPQSERDAVTWTQLVTIWQVIGRLVRGGSPARVFFCDAAFARHTVTQDERGDSPSTSLLVGMKQVLRPYFTPDSNPCIPVSDQQLVQALYAFPNLQELINNPESGLNLEGQHSAVIVYRNGIKPQHQVKAGLPPFDRRQLIEEIACLLTEELDLVDMPERVQFSCSNPTNPFLEQTDDDNRLSQLQVQRRNSISRVTENQLAVEIWHQSDLILGALSQAVRECLGDSALAENSSLNLTVNAQPLGAIGSDLQIDSTIRSRKERRRQAILQRGEEIIEQLAPASIPTVALIELGNADQFETDTDPKNAIRRGFAQTGRLVQFLSTEHDGKLLHRAQNGFLDVLRQLGVQAAPLQLSPLGLKERQSRQDVSLPNPLHYVGVWLIKQNAPTSATGEVQRVPVMVHMASDSADIQATAPGLDGWLPYREALVAIARGEATGFSRSQEAIRFIQPTLERDVVPLGDVLLLCHAQNLGCAWSWLYNRQITIDSLAFSRNETPMPITAFPGLRVVRVRDSQGHQTPEWYAQAGDEQGFSGGLFRMGERIFASTCNPPQQFKFNRNLSKISSWSNRNGKWSAPAPEKSVWNPGLLELTVAGIQPDDEIWTWAALTHELRSVALHYDEALGLPLPLHLAKQIEEYVLLIDVDEEVTPE